MLSSESGSLSSFRHSLCFQGLGFLKVGFTAKNWCCAVCWPCPTAWWHSSLQIFCSMSQLQWEAPGILSIPRLGELHPPEAACVQGTDSKATSTPALPGSCALWPSYLRMCMLDKESLLATCQRFPDSKSSGRQQEDLKKAEHRNCFVSCCVC